MSDNCDSPSVRLRSVNSNNSHDVDSNGDSDRQVNPQEVPQPSEGQPQTPPVSAAQKFRQVIFQMVMMYTIFNFFRKSPVTPQSESENGKTFLGPATNLFPNGTIFDLYVYVSLEENGTHIDFESSTLVWQESGLIYGDWYSGEYGDGTRTKSFVLPLTKDLQNNGSMYIHSFVVKHNKSPNPADGKKLFNKKWTILTSRRLNKFMKKVYKKTSNLITGETETSESDLEKIKAGISHEIISHWHPNMTINMVVDFSPFTPAHVPPPLDAYYQFIPPELSQYKPVVFYNDYWNLNRDHQPLNETLESIEMRLTFQPLSLFKFQLYASQLNQNKFGVLNKLMGGGGGSEKSATDDKDSSNKESEVSVSDQMASWFSQNEGEDDQDNMKETLLGTNVYLLVITFVISVVHSIFEFLAFKNGFLF